MDLFVAVGSLGKLATATNVETWQQRTSSFGNSSIYAVAFGDGKFIAGGSTGKMAVSENGINWTQVNSSFGSSVILDINFFEPYNLWIAVGGSGKLATSENGIDWVMRSSSFGTSFIRSIFSNSTQAIAVGDDGKLANSLNGLSWLQRNSSFSITSIYGVDGRENFYCAVGNTGKIGYSSNGTSWIQATYPTSFGTSGLRDIKAGTSNDSALLAAGFSGKLGTAFDVNFWSERVSTFGSSRINSIFYGENIAIAVGNAGKIAYSI
jgi:hypothetical protein